MTIHIEIKKGYAEGKWSIRIGDIEGSVEYGNITVAELLEEIRNEIEEKKVKKRSENENKT